MPSLATAAVAYAERGIPVFPLHRQSKKPYTTHGFKDATTNPKRIARWWDGYPLHNIGLVTGDKFDVLDVDGKEGYRALMSAMPADAEPIYGPTVRTGKGWQVWMQPTGHGRRLGFLPHVDWLGTGGYCIAPPSVHPNGRRYRWCLPSWANQHAPLEAAPAWLLELVNPPAPEAEKAVQPPVSTVDRFLAGHRDGQPSPADLIGRVPWATILEPHGFTLLHQRGDSSYWAHPAQTSPKGTVAATTDVHAPVLVVFSGSTSTATGLPTGEHQRLTKFRVYTILDHRGDPSAAASAIRHMTRKAA